MTTTITRADAGFTSEAPALAAQGATPAEKALAIGLWAVVGGALTFGIVATVVKASGLFGA